MVSAVTLLAPASLAARAAVPRARRGAPSRLVTRSSSSTESAKAALADGVDGLAEAQRQAAETAASVTADLQGAAAALGPSLTDASATLRATVDSASASASAALDGAVPREALDAASQAVDTVTDAFGAAAPILQSVASTLASIVAASPTASATALLVLLLARLRSVSVSPVVSAAEAQALLDSRSALLVDIRDTPKEQPDIRVASYIAVPLPKLTGAERSRLNGGDADDVELTMAACQLAALKKLRDGQAVVLLDGGGGGLARRLAAKVDERRGRRKSCLVVDGGFDGWSEANLSTRPSNSSALVAEIVRPIRALLPSSSSATGTGAAPRKRLSLPSLSSFRKGGGKGSQKAGRKM